MSGYKFTFIAMNGMKSTVIEADSITLIDGEGNKLELYPRKSDGDITLSASDRLVIMPWAANCARIKSMKQP